MPRQARRKSNTGIYHVMMRGVNQQPIFEDAEDNRKLIEIIKKYKAISEYQVFAYCLMGNHFHLLLKIGKDDIGQIVKRIAGSYVYWYNLKYQRIGHLFQERFNSEPIEDDEYFLSVLRYIHQNPVKIGIKVGDYKYSSYNDYVKMDNRLVDIDFALSMMDTEQFIRFNNKENDDECLSYDKKDFRISDVDAKVIIENVSKSKSVTEFQSLDKKQRDSCIKQFKEAGMSIRQISRLTGIGKGVVARIP